MGNSAWRLLAVAAALLPPVAETQAANWDIQPSIAVQGKYTDNFNLSPNGDSDFITEVTPGLRVSGRGARLRADLNYTPSLLYYVDHEEESTVANSLTASANLEAIENFFFVDFTGNIDQRFLSPFGARPGDVATVTDNRAETRTFGISPYIQGRMGQVSYLLRNNNLWTRTDSDLTADANTTSWSGRLDGPVGRLFAWSLEYNRSDIDYDNFQGRPEQRSELYRARLYFQPVSSLRLFVSGGEEKNNFIQQEERNYSMYGAGLRWTPTLRTTAEAEYEKRYFGPSRLFNFSHRTRLTAWRLSYSKNASNFQQEVLRLPPGNTALLLDAIFAARIPDPIDRARAVIQFLRDSGTPLFLATPLSFYTQEIFVQERAEASVGILGVRNSITFTVFASDSTALSEGLGTLLPDFGLPGRQIRQHGFGVNASHRLTPFTTIGANGGRTISREDEPVGLETTNDNIGLTVTRRLSPKTNIFGGITHTRFQDNIAPDRDQTTIYAGLSHLF